MHAKMFYILTKLNKWSMRGVKFDVDANIEA